MYGRNIEGELWPRTSWSGGPCAGGHLLSDAFSPVPALRNWAPGHLLDKEFSLYFFAAFSAPGSKLQAVYDDPRLAPSNPELHEDTTVSFRPGTGQTWPGDGRGELLSDSRSVPSGSANAL